MDKKLKAIVFLGSIYLYALSCCLELDIYVSDSKGKNGYQCTVEMPCRTLDYGYNKAISNTSISVVNIVLLGPYIMNKSLFVNRSSGNLTTLKISGYREAEVIGSRNVSIVIGCKTSSNCIHYNISIENLIFRNYSKGTVITAYNVPRVKLTNCTFVRNRGTVLEGYDTSIVINRSNFIGGQSTLSTKESFHKYYSKSICSGGAVRLVFEYGHSKHVDIRQSKFLNNFADEVDRRSCGGALSLVFENNASNNRINIEASHFEGNHAQVGGGFSIRLSHRAAGNKFVITNSVISKNHAAQSGGGFSVEAFDSSSKNSITFHNITFVKNVAESSGGAGKLLFHNEGIDVIEHVFDKSTFIGNRAQIQAAIGLMRTHRASPLAERMVVVFRNTVFSSNAFITNTTFTHSGAVTAFYVDVQFIGNNSFNNNWMNSPLYACGSNVNVSGYLSFSENIACFAGGGMSLVDGSKLIMMPEAHVEFYKNYASVAGGAIFYESTFFDNEVIPFNPLCFVQYGRNFVAAKNWNVTMRFTENGAGYKGAAVYATTVNQCVWIPEKPNVNASAVLQWSDRFIYTKNYLGYFKQTNSSPDLSNDLVIATDTSRYGAGTSAQTAFPGENVTMRLQAFDEYGQRTSTFATLISFHLTNNTQATNSRIRLDRKFVYSDPRYPNLTQFRFSLASEDQYNLALKGKMISNHIVEAIDHSSIHGARMLLNITMETCPPGYRFDLELKYCVCDYQLQGLTGCEGRIIRIQDGLWANVSQKNPNKLIIYYCPKSFCKCDSGESYRSDCELNPKSPDRQCKPNREGILCGKCKSGSSITLPTYRCRSCDSLGSSIAIFVFFVILTILLCFGIIYFNPKVSEYLFGVLFYTQILPYVFTDSDSLSASIATIFCTIINSVAVGSMPVEMCLFPGLDRIDAIGFSYIIPTICVLILAVFYVLNYFRILNFNRDSPFNAFWILIIVVYKLLVETTLQSLACHKVDGDLVFFFDGSVKCFSKEHLALFVPSVLILVFIVIPFPFLIILISFGHIRVAPHVSDIIAKGYRDEFRWWFAFDVSRRLAYSAIYIFVSHWTIKKILLLCLSAFISTTHAIVGPYKNKYANYGESFLLGSLTLIAAIQMLPDAEKTTRNIASIIALAPTIIYSVIVVFHLVLNCIRESGLGCFHRKVDKSIEHFDDMSMPIPKRVFFERTVYRSNRRGSDLDDENASPEPSPCCTSQQELCSLDS